MDTTTNSTSYKPNKNKPSIHSSSSEEDVRRAAKSKQHANTNATGKNNATGTTHNRFIRRLFACSGYCACSSRHSLSASNSAYGLSKSATNIQANNTATNNKANKTAFSNNTNDNETDNNNNNNNNNNDNINNEIENKNSQPHSDFNEIKMPEEITSKCTSNHGNRKGQQSYESLIDKILSTPTKLRPNNVSQAGGSSKPISILSSKSISKKSNDNTSSESAPPSKSSPAVKASTFKPRKIILNETLKKLESDNHKLFKKEAITDKVDKNGTSSNIPVLKVNDMNVVSQTNSSIRLVKNDSDFGKERVSANSTSSATNIQTNMEDSDEYDEEDIEDTGDEDETVDIEALEREVLKALRSHGCDEYDLYRDLDELETEQNYDLYCGLVENEDETFDNLEGDSAELKIKFLKNRMKQKNAKRNKSKNSCSSGKSERSETAENVSEWEPRRKSCNDEEDDLLFDSNKYFDSLQHFQMTDATSANYKSNSNSNLSFQKTTNSSGKAGGTLLDYGESLTSANNGANLFVLLAANRNKAKQANKINNKNSSNEMLDSKNQSHNKNDSESHFLSPKNIVPSVSLSNDLLATSEDKEQGSFIRQASHEPALKKNSHVNFNNKSINTSVSVSTTNTSDSNITTSHSLNLPQSLLESMSQVSSNYSIDKSSPTLPMRTTTAENEMNALIKNNSLKVKVKKSSKNEINLEESEESDVLNEIFKVNQWLTDNHQLNKNALISQLLCETRNQNSIESILSNSEVNNENDDDYEEDQIGPHNDPNKSSSGENNDSAIDISSYGSFSNLCKISSKKTRVKWQSFTKYYHLNLQHNNANLSKYQISVISCEQLMILRKLALSQFSKLLERQHSSMIRTLRLFSKKRDLAEFQKVYDSIDSLSRSNSTKLKSNTSNKDSDNLKNSQLNSENVIIDTKKISHQLGAQIGCHPSNEVVNRRKRRKSKLKKLEEQLLNEKLNIILPKSGSNSIFHESEMLTGDKVSQTGPVTEYKNVNDNLKNTIFNNSHKTMRVVFGVPLSTIIQQTGQALPQRILEAMKFIRKIAQHEVGIFRKNGVKTRITKLKELIDKNEPINFQNSDFTVFDVADMIKLYFRELPECLLTNKLSDILLTNYNKILPEERKVVLQQVMLLIPDENRMVLQTLLLFLSEIAKHNKVNQMTRANLAVCFSPVIFRFSLENKTNYKHPNIKEMSTPRSTSTTTQVSQVASGSNVTVSENASTSSIAQIATITTLHKNSSNSNVTNFLSSIPQEISLPTQQPSKPNTTETNNNSNSQDPDEISTTSRTVETITIDNESHKNSTESVCAKLPVDLTTSMTSKQFSEYSSVTEETNKKQIVNFTEINSSSSSNTFTSSQQPIQGKDKQNYKRKYSEKINRAASSIVNFGAELSSSKPTNFFTDSFKENLENMSKVIQLCVSDMIKYSMDLFTIPIESYEKLSSAELTTRDGSPVLDFFYNSSRKELKNANFFTSKFSNDKIQWTYQDKFEDVSIYFCKHDQSSQTSANQTDSHSNSSVSNTQDFSEVVSTLTSVIVSKPDSFGNKLKLWKCCTLVKTQNLTLEKILSRIKNERHLWDDDFVEGKVTEVLDDNTELFKSVISFMPPHPSREFFEIRHLYMQTSNSNVAILTSSSVKSTNGSDDLETLNIKSNLVVSKYVIEKLIANDTTTTYKITHYAKLDYRGFTLEFYNKTFGFIMARLLYNLKVSLTKGENKS